MKGEVVWILLCFAVSVSAYFMLPKMFPLASSIKVNQAIKRRIVMRNKVMEMKRVLKKYKPKSFRYRDRMDGLDKVPKEEKKYIVQIFAKTKQYERMQWTYLNKIVSDTPLRATLDGIYAGGIEAEESLRSLEFNISNSLYTRARNGRVGLRNSTRGLVYEVLPQLQRANPKLFEFGYRLLDGENSGKIFPISQAMTGIPPAPSHEELVRQYRKNSPVEQIDVYKVVSLEINRMIQSRSRSASFGKISVSASNSTSKAESSSLVDICPALFESVDAFLDSIMDSGIERLVFSADGGALMSRSKDCVISNAGIFILPEDNAFHRVEQSNKLKKGLYGRHIATLDSTKGLSPLMIRITGAESFVETPFEAELLAGLTAVTLVNLLHRKHDRRTLGMSRPLSSQIISDSRAFLRTTATFNGMMVGEVSSHHETVDPKSTRGVLTSLLTNQLKLLAPSDDINARSSSSEIAAARRCVIKWMMGHPEKRETDSNK